MVGLLIAFCAFGTFLTYASPLKRTADQFTFYNLKTPLSGPCDLVEGPDGALWGESILVNHIFRIDPLSGQVEEYPIPSTNPITGQILPTSVQNDRTELSCAIRTGTDGNIYASNGLRNQLVKIVPSTRKISVFTPQPYNPLGDLQPFNDLSSGKDGMYFTQTTGNLLSYFDYATQKIKSYEVPTPASFPLGLFVTAEEQVVVAETIGNKIFVLNGKTGEMVEHALPEPAQFPAVVRAQTSDGLIWYSLVTGNGVGSVDLKTGETKVYHTGEFGALGAEDTIDKDGNIWLSFFNINALAKFNPLTKTFTLINFPDSVTNEPVGIPPYVDIAVTYGPENAIWFTDISHNRIGKYSLS